MEVSEIGKLLFEYGGTTIMALLFIWFVIIDKTKNSKAIEDNTAMLKALSESNNNIAKALDIISNNLLTLDDKADRNYEAIIYKEVKK